MGSDSYTTLFVHTQIMLYNILKHDLLCMGMRINRNKIKKTQSINKFSAIVVWKFDTRKKQISGNL